MYTDFIKHIEHHDLCRKTDKILLAVSGGVDSVVMANLFHRHGFKFGMAHCNFGLRGAESDGDEQFVAALAKKYSVPFHVQRFPAADYSKQKGISVQMAARELRYGWFEDLCSSQKYDFIATAHHLDDQIETFFINLIRGTGISGLHGIPVKYGKVIRPLLFIYRKQIEDYAMANHLHYRSDSSNASTKYLRNKIRHELIPVINEMNPDFNHQLTSAINRINDIELIADQAIVNWKKKVIQETGLGFIIDIPALRDATPLLTLTWELLSPFGFNQSQVNNIVQSLSRGHGKIFLSPTHRAVKNRLQLIIQPLPVPGKNEPKHVTLHQFIRRKSLKHPIPLLLEKINDPSHYKIPSSNNIASLDCDKIFFPLILRKWEPGDVFYPFGLNRKKKLSDFFIDQKFSLPDKENCWLLCSGNHIVWVVGHRIDHRFRITAKTKQILNIVTNVTCDT
jgi:tRNA(Ile)-lysidine synthase